jgi:hypothetical protein
LIFQHVYTFQNGKIKTTCLTGATFIKDAHTKGFGLPQEPSIQLGKFLQKVSKMNLEDSVPKEKEASYRLLRTENLRKLAGSVQKAVDGVRVQEDYGVDEDRLSLLSKHMGVEPKKEGLVVKRSVDFLPEIRILQPLVLSCNTFTEVDALVHHLYCIWGAKGSCVSKRVCESDLLTLFKSPAWARQMSVVATVRMLESNLTPSDCPTPGFQFAVDAAHLLDDFGTKDSEDKGKVTPIVDQWLDGSAALKVYRALEDFALAAVPLVPESGLAEKCVASVYGNVLCLKRRDVFMVKSVTHCDKLAADYKAKVSREKKEAELVAAAEKLAAEVEEATRNLAIWDTLLKDSVEVHQTTLAKELKECDKFYHHKVEHHSTGVPLAHMIGRLTKEEYELVDVASDTGFPTTSMDPFTLRVSKNRGRALKTITDLSNDAPSEIFMCRTSGVPNVGESVEALNLLVGCLSPQVVILYGFNALDVAVRFVAVDGAVGEVADTYQDEHTYVIVHVVQVMSNQVEEQLPASHPHSGLSKVEYMGSVSTPVVLILKKTIAGNLRSKSSTGALPSLPAAYKYMSAKVAPETEPIHKFIFEDARVFPSMMTTNYSGEGKVAMVQLMVAKMAVMFHSWAVEHVPVVKVKRSLSQPKEDTPYTYSFGGSHVDVLLQTTLRDRGLRCLTPMPMPLAEEIDAFGDYKLLMEGLKIIKLEKYWPHQGLLEAMCLEAVAQRAGAKPGIHVSKENKSTATHFKIKDVTDHSTTVGGKIGKGVFADRDLPLGATYPLDIAIFPAVGFEGDELYRHALEMHAASVSLDSVGLTGALKTGSTFDFLNDPKGMVSKISNKAATANAKFEMDTSKMEFYLKTTREIARVSPSTHKHKHKTTNTHKTTTHKHIPINTYTRKHTHENKDIQTNTCTHTCTQTHVHKCSSTHRATKYLSNMEVVFGTHWRAPRWSGAN